MTKSKNDKYTASDFGAGSNSEGSHYVGRFAPSPSGALHYGSLITALASFLDARHNRGKWLLRIEDLDFFRNSENASLEIQNQLKGFRLFWDEEVQFQSSKTVAYSKALDQLSQKKYVSVELGLQTLNDHQLIFLSRHHDRHCSLEAIEKLKALSNVDISVHLMFGIPEETEEQLIETAQLLSELGVHSVKLHNLHVLANTPLATLYSQGNFVPIELEEYFDRKTPSSIRG